MTASRLDILNNFLTVDPDDPFNHYTVALELVALQRFEEAIGKFRDALVLDPKYVPAYHQLGLLYAQLDRADEARDALEKGIRAATQAGDAHARGEMQDAIDELDD